MKQYSFLTENLLLEAPAYLKSMFGTFQKTAGKNMTQKGLQNFARERFTDQRAREAFMKYGLGRLGGQKVAQAKQLTPQIQTQLRAGGIGNQQLADKLTMQQNQLTNNFNNLKNQAQQFKKPLTGGGKGMSRAIDDTINKNAILSSIRPQVSVTNQQISNVTNTLKPSNTIGKAWDGVKTAAGKTYNGLTSDTAKFIYKGAGNIVGKGMDAAGTVVGGTLVGGGLLGAAALAD